MGAALTVEDSSLVVFEKSARHHHENTGEDLPDTEFQLLLNVLPERLGARVRITDQFRDGTATVDVGVLYYWERDATPLDNLDGFAEQTALPQALSCAASLLATVASEITSDDVPFYGFSALDGLLTTFRQRRSLSERLKEALTERAKQITDEG